MKSIVIFIIAVPSLSIQQYYNQGYDIVNYQPYNYDNHYVSGKYRRSSAHKHRHSRKYDSAHLPTSYESSDTESFQDTCECECQRCADPKPCCMQVCHAECQEQMPANLVFVPYPYPLVMPDVHPSTPTATKTTPTTTQTTPTTTPTTKASTTTTTERTEVPPEEPVRLKCDQKSSSNRIGSSFYDDLRANMLRSKQEYQNEIREQLGIRPVKPNPVSKYGIIPIPDRILQSLFSQVKGVKRPLINV